MVKSKIKEAIERRRDIFLPVATGSFFGLLVSLLAITLVSFQAVTYDVDGAKRDQGFWKKTGEAVAINEGETIPIQLPGPLDAWAGGESKKISFAIPFSGRVKIDLAFLDSHESAPPLLAISVDGKEAGRLQSEKGNGLRYHLWKEKGRHSSHSITVDAPFRLSGASIVSIRSLEGSWIAIESVTIKNRPDRWLAWLAGFFAIGFVISVILHVVGRKAGRVYADQNSESGKKEKIALLPYEKKRRDSTITVGLTLVFFAFVINPASLSAFFASLSLEEGFAIKLFILRAIMLSTGVMLITFRKKPLVANSVGRVADASQPTFGAIAFILIFYLLVENIACYAFFYAIPKESRKAALTSAGVWENRENRTVPHLWSNFVPNKKRGAVNEHGYRWGGGPKNSAIRILCIGGSTTWGHGVGFGENSYPALMERYLRKKGYDIDVINAGVFYYSSMEELTTLSFRGIHEKPDIVLIHSGINDVEPVLAPAHYRPDYSHWRTVEPKRYSQDKNMSYRSFWSLPSWSIRLFYLLWLRPDGSLMGKTALQSYTLPEALAGENAVGRNNIEGFRANLLSMAAVTRANGAEPLFIDFSIQYDHPDNDKNIFAGLSSNQKIAAKERWQKAASMIKGAIHEIGRDNNILVLNFSSFSPKPPAAWIDFIHLSLGGNRQKAQFIGDHLISSGLLENSLNRR